tara:strand:+ start:1657 stop:2034 length:378 start_codon:yes stop_codon:yes gene_type:complete
MASDPADRSPPVHVLTTNAELSDLVTDEENPLVVVQFSAPWCKMCAPMADLVSAAAKHARASVAKVSTPDAEDLVESYGVTKLPMVLVWRNGTIHARVEGFDQEAVRRAIVAASWGVHGMSKDEI